MRRDHPAPHRVSRTPCCGMLGPVVVLVPRQIRMTGMTGGVPYYGGRFTPAQAYAAAHPPHPAPRPPPPAAPPPPAPGGPGGGAAAPARRRRHHAGGARRPAGAGEAVTGPVQVLVVGFDAPSFSGEVLAELTRLREQGVVRWSTCCWWSAARTGPSRPSSRRPAPTLTWGRSRRRSSAGRGRRDRRRDLVARGRGPAWRGRRDRADRASLGGAAGRGDRPRGRAPARRAVAPARRPSVSHAAPRTTRCQRRRVSA